VSVEASTIDMRHPRQGVSGGPGTSDPGHVRMNGMSPFSLLMLAFDMQRDQLKDVKVQGPSYFDIEATLPRGATKDQYKEMLRNLLVERFGLKYHIDTRDVDGYELRVGKVKMRAAEPSSEGYEHAPPHGLLRQLDAHGAPELQPGRKGLSRFALPTGGTRISARMQQAADVAQMCRQELEAPVVDRTGLTVEFDFNLDFLADARKSQFSWMRRPADAAPAAEAGDSTEATLKMADFRQAVQEQLGLRLVKKKVPFESVVVESTLKGVEN
jgi:uncharacterized protein (TIGR03435 family)